MITINLGFCPKQMEFTEIMERAYNDIVSVLDVDIEGFDPDVIGVRVDEIKEIIWDYNHGLINARQRNESVFNAWHMHDSNEVYILVS
jgi:hypothetical protein